MKVAPAEGGSITASTSDEAARPSRRPQTAVNFAPGPRGEEANLTPVDLDKDASPADTEGRRTDDDARDRPSSSAEKSWPPLGDMDGGVPGNALASTEQSAWESHTHSGQLHKRPLPESQFQLWLRWKHYMKRKIAQWFKGQLVGGDIDLVVKGLQSGFVMDTPLRAWIIHVLVLLVVLIVSLANPTQEKRAIIFNIPQTPFAAANAGFFIQTVLFWIEAGSLGATAVCVMLPKASRWWIRHLPYLDAAVIMAEFLRLPTEAMVGVAMKGDMESLGMSFSSVISRSVVLSLMWGLFLAATASPLGPRMGHDTWIAGILILLAGQAAKDVVMGWHGASSIIRAPLISFLFAKLCTWFFLFFSPRTQEEEVDPRTAVTQAITMRRQVARGHSGATTQASRGQAIAARQCQCRRCRRAMLEAASSGRALDEHSHGRSMGCMFGRFLRFSDDEVAVLRVLTIAMWIIMPMGISLACYQLVLVTIEPGSASSTDNSLTSSTSAWFDVAVPTWLIFTTCLVLAVGIRLSRVTVQQRDALLGDIVPREVADALILKFAKEQAHVTDGGNGAPTGLPGSSKTVGSHDRNASNKGSSRGVIKSGPDDSVAAGEEGDTFEELANMGPEGLSRVLSPRGQTSTVSSGALGGSMGSDRTSGVMSVGRSGSSFTVMPEITSACGAVGVETVPLTYYKEHSEVTMMFSDMVGYTAMSSTLHPQTVLVTLHSIFSVLDKVTTYLRVYKYETVGDAYIVASNLLRNDRKHRVTALTMAVTLINVVRDVTIRLPDGTVKQLEARVGLHTGPVAAGVLGLKRTVMTLVGDTLNTASRMESNSLPSHVQATEDVWLNFPEQYQELFTRREIDVKGKGLMTVYLLDVVGKAQECATLGLNLFSDPVLWERIMSNKK